MDKTERRIRASQWKERKVIAGIYALRSATGGL